MDLTTENKILKTLLKDKVVHVNYHSTDCDGVGAHGSASFTTVEHLERWIDNNNEAAEGPWGYEVCKEEDKQENVSGYGGWGIN